VRATTSLSETERIDQTRSGEDSEEEEWSGGRVMWSNEGAAPLHAWRWKRRQSQQAKRRRIIIIQV